MQTCFHIADGRTCFYQWDINRKMIVTDESIKELHFCNGTSDCSLVCTVVDGVADVPNILLQTAVNINIYGFTGDHTEIKKIYSVLPRTRPADYVYTETEIKRYETLENRIKALEDSGPPQDGFSPTVSVAPIDGGNRVTITDKEGPETFEVLDGKNGKDGVSPTVTVNAIEGGNRVIITDKDGPKQFDVLNGKDREGGGIAAEPVPAGEVIALLAENDLMLAVQDESGILADEEGNILEW